MDPYAANAWYQEYKAGNWPIKINMEKFNSQGGGGHLFHFHPEAFKRYMHHHAIGDVSDSGSARVGAVPSPRRLCRNG